MSDFWSGQEHFKSGGDRRSLDNASDSFRAGYWHEWGEEEKSTVKKPRNA